MASAGRTGGRSSVRRHLSLLVLANLFVLVIVGVGGIVAAIRAHDSVRYLTQSVAPASQANAAAMQVLTDTETFVWGYAISGDPVQLSQYRDAVDWYQGRRTQLERFKSLDGQLSFRIDDFLRATDNWIEVYAEPRVAGKVGVETFDDGRFDRGRALFNEIRIANAGVDRRLDEMTDDAEISADNLSSSIVFVLVGVLVAGATLSWLIGSRVGRRVTEPLGELEQTAHKLAVGEHDARAPVSGPGEVVQVATAINKMADENDRARSVEARVVEQLRALDAVKSDFVSNVSHELRTPLTSILGYLELLEEEIRERPVDSELEMIAATKRNVIRLGELIDDLLALTRSEDRRADLVSIDLALLVRDIVTDLRVASSQQGVDIRLGLPGTPVPVRADAGQIARVVTNLVSNAVKFSQGASEVAVTVVVDGKDAVMTVEDHGIGIPADEMDQLGSRFYRASNAVGMGITGTGLGLRIVQAIVENHQGSIDLRSEQGVGTTIWVRIPLDHELEDEAAVEVDPAERPAERRAESAAESPPTTAGAVG
jgi:two-component system OmpR family sensor kinase